MVMRSREWGWISKDSICWRGENQIQVEKKKGIEKKSTGGINGKRNIRRHIGPLLSAEEKIKANDTEEAELQNAFFGSLFTMTSVEIKQREMVQTEAKRKVQEIEIC